MDHSSNSLGTNRSLPASTIIPVLSYEDVNHAVDWLCNAFGFIVRLRIGTHRAQLLFRDGAIIASERPTGTTSFEPSPSNDIRFSVLMRVEDVNQHYEHAQRNGAQILQPPTDHPYGERQYVAEDIGGHRWTFSQSIVDVEPSQWGATTPK